MERKPITPKPPNGYRILPRGDTLIPKGKGPHVIVWIGSSWRDSDGSLGGRPTRILADSFFCAVPIVPRTPKPHVWEPRTLEIGPKATREVLKALVLESVDEINQLGKENAKLKNQITKLKQEAAK